MKIPGYDDAGPVLDGPSLSFDGAELLDLPGFWPAHLGGHLMHTTAEAAELFGDDETAVKETYDRLTDCSAWPVFFFGTGRGARLAVVYRNFEEDWGVDYLVIPDDGGPATTFATDEGGQFGRGITWNEATALADRQPGAREQATVLLLLAPVINRFEAGDEDVVTRLAGALRTVGVTGDAELIASRILHPDDDEDGDYDDDEDRDRGDDGPPRTPEEQAVDRILAP